MKYSIFVSKVQEKQKVEIPAFIMEKLKIQEGDFVEITVKKIKSRRMQLSISENPLLKLIKESEDE